MDLRDMFTTWQEEPGEAFYVTVPLSRTGCPCLRVPRAMWKIRTRIIERMDAEGHQLNFHPRYEVSHDAIGVRCHNCGLLVEGFVGRISSDEVLLLFRSPVITTCEGEKT